MSIQDAGDSDLVSLRNGSVLSYGGQRLRAGRLALARGGIAGGVWTALTTAPSRGCLEFDGLGQACIVLFMASLISQRQPVQFWFTV